MSAFAVPLAPALAPHEANSAQAARSLLDDPAEWARFSATVPGPDGQDVAESSFQLGGMHCAACSGLIEAALLGVPGVAEARVSAAAQRATVRWCPSQTRPSALLAAVEAIGYTAVPDTATAARALRRREHRQALWRLFVAAFCAMQIMMLATPAYVAGDGADLSSDLRQLLNWGSWLLCVPVLLFSAGPFFRGAWVSLKRRRVGMDVPVALAVFITFVAGTAATFDPAGRLGATVYFDSLSMFVALLLGARYLELRARHRAEDELEASMACLPEVAWRLSGAADQREAVAPHSLRPGDRVMVPLGEAFPADGELVQGQTEANEAVLTGESARVLKRPGSEVVAGSLNLGQPVVMVVHRAGADTQAQAIVRLMRSAATQQAPGAALADRWAGVFLIAVMLLALMAGLVWWRVDPPRALEVAVAVLIVTCPCALSLALPATLVAAARGLAARGVLLRRLDALERLANIDTVALDKTGTLTDGTLQITAVQFRDPAQAPSLTAVCANLASHSRHPAAEAVSHWAVQSAVRPAMTWQHVDEVPGQGVWGTDDQGRTLRLGRAEWACSPASEAQAVDPRRPPMPHPPSDALCFSVDGQCEIVFKWAEALRMGAAEAVKGLQGEGLALHLISGDHSTRVQSLANAMGIVTAQAHTSPEGKLASVKRLQTQGHRVLMAGDGFNDAPVLAQADVSAALAEGAAVTRAQADLVLTRSDLSGLLDARLTARRTVRILRQNLGWSAAYNGICVPLALLGYLPPWLAALGMAGSSLLVVLNALRATQPPPITTGLR